MSDKFELRNIEGEVVWTGNDRKAIAGFDLPEGIYTLWKFQGTLPVAVLPARKRVVFESANPKGPRQPRSAPAPAASEAVAGEPIT